MSDRPGWLRVAARESAGYRELTAEFAVSGLTTVCSESGCPNIWECYSRRHATVLIMGDVCSRACAYCRISSGSPQEVDVTETERVAGAVASLNLSDIVVTSVSRDDLADGGAEIYERTIEAIRMKAPQCRIEVLIPDFSGDWQALERVAAARPDMIGHNMETVARLFPDVRPQANYRLSLMLLKRLVASGMPVKSGIMVGLGERRTEIRQTLDDIAACGVKTIVIGQYLAPSPQHPPVRRYYRPAEFMGLAGYAQRIGFKRIISGPLVRSSYRGLILTPVSGAECLS